MMLRGFRIPRKRLNGIENSGMGGEIMWSC